MKIKYLFALYILISILPACANISQKTVITQTKTVPHEIMPQQQVYFCPRDNCSSIMMQHISSSNNVDCAFFDLNIPELISLLAEKNARIIVDNENEEDLLYNIQNLKFDNSNQYSHNKFCILDNSIIITGSMNPTNNGDKKNNNNLIIFYSQYLAENYNDEFNELWNREFGKGKQVKYPIIYINEKKIENYFCPEDNCKTHIINTLNNAKSSIYFMAFSFTDKDIANKLIEKHNQGIEVKGILEKKRINMKYNVYKQLKQGNINVIPDNNKYTLHHKTFIIDNSTVITGSMNPTKSGNTKNDENVVIIHDKEIAESFIKEFRRLLDEDF